MGPGHDKRRGDPLVGDVADGDAEASARHLDEVVEVATDRARRAVIGGDLPLRQVRQLAGEELLLDEGGDPHLLLEALALGGFVCLLADELGDPDGRRRLSGEGGEESAVVRRVLLLREARAEVQRPDQFALGDERDDQGHAGLAHGTQRRRVEFQLGDLHGAGRGLEVGEQRIRLGDGNRDGRIVSRGSGRFRGCLGQRHVLRDRDIVTTSRQAADRTSQFGHVVVTFAAGRPGIVTAIMSMRAS